MPLAQSRDGSDFGSGFGFFRLSSGRVSGFCIFPRVKNFWLRVQLESKLFFKSYIFELDMGFSTSKSLG